ncbi:MATE family efflux transporter [Lachnoclostridium sp. Marseille-P6806]|uniref:MATE family efflux transporter n=1 Tax=Lachnoclostridium sp. Marseille-P6806 TaxID=2364793 RepID=UPI001031F751|nr:MATE family efflux transporter [Lachnoclostridium sp. Marseille-P6806]
MTRFGFAKRYIGDAEFYSRAGRVAFPVALQSMITIGVNMLDTVMLGRLGETALSSSALANQFIGIYHICCMGIGMGASVMMSRYWGMKELCSLRQTVTVMLRICAAVGMVFTLVTLLAPTQIMRVYTPEADVIQDGVGYFRLSALSYLLTGFSLTLSIALRSVGLAGIPLLSACSSFSVNLLCNWIFIFGNLGAPRLETAGAALGTLIARAVELVILGGYFFFFDARIRYRVNDLFFSCRTILPEYLRISVPVIVSDSLMAFGNSAVAMIMGRIGAGFVAANSITFVTQQLTMVLTQGVSQAGCIITGNTLGEGRREQAFAEGYWFTFLGTALGVIACLVILCISRPVTGFYRVMPETRAIALDLMHAVAFLLIFQSANSILTKGVLRGGGDTKFLMFADVFFLWAASVPLGILAGLYWKLPAFWIYFFMKIDQIIKCAVCMYRLRSGRWIKDIYAAETV